MRDLIAEGGTAFYDATAEAFDAVRAQKATDRINAVVLLTDGETRTPRNRDEVVAHLERQGDSDNRVRVFTIAYSSGATGARGQLSASRRRRAASVTRARRRTSSPSTAPSRPSSRARSQPPTTAPASTGR